MHYPKTNFSIKKEYAEIIKKQFPPQRSFLNNHIKHSHTKYYFHKSISFFKKSLESHSLLSKGSKTPIVGYFCNLIPQEIIYACGAIPLRLDSSDSAAASKGEHLAQQDICPVIKSILGSMQLGQLNKIDLLIIPSSCENKTKLTELLSPFIDVYFLSIPRDSDYYNSISIWESELEKLSAFLEKRYKHKMKDLPKYCKLHNERTALFRELAALRIKRPGVINNIEYFTITNSAGVTKITEWNKNLHDLLKNTEKINSKQLGKRILLCGSPIFYPNFKLLELLTELNCDIVADTLCSGYQNLYDPIILNGTDKKSLITALALKYFSATICPCFINNFDKLTDRIIDLSKEHQLSGVIYHNLRLCNTFETPVTFLKTILKKHNIPILFIKTDLAKEDTAQLKTRLEAFLEILN